MTVIQTIKEWRRYLEESTIDNIIVTDHKNLIYFQNARIINRRQARWTLEIQNIPFRLEYQKRKDNVIADALTRKEDAIEELEPRSIFLQTINIEKTKKQDYHPSMEITEVKKQDDDRWKYRKKLIMEQKDVKREIIKQNHDDPRTRHPEFKETLRQVTEMIFWNGMRKDVTEYIKKCLIYQKKKKTLKTGLGGAMGQSEDI